jgi:hypothetical protein
VLDVVLVRIVFGFLVLHGLYFALSMNLSDAFFFMNHYA